jgi:small-conductance mechanosensitive channel/CRP-like cAMP-binding protein
VYPAFYWLIPVLFALTIGLWPIARERGRLRTSIVLLALAVGIGLLSRLPAYWFFAPGVVREVAFAFAELSVVQVLAVIAFDLVLRRIRVPKFASEILIVAAYFAVIFEVLFKLGVNVTGIFATSAVAAAVVGLALQDMLSNIAGGIALELEDGIQPGDFIHTADAAGWVQHVRLRHTSLSTQEGDTLILPNNQLTRSAVRITSPKHRHLVPFSMPYDINPQQAIDAVEFALRASPVPGVSIDPAPQCVMQEMAPGHIRYAAVVWLANPGRQLDEISAVLMRIYFALQRAGMPVMGISQAVDLRNADSSKKKEEHRNLSAVEVLQRTPVLRLLEEPELLALASHLRRVSFAPGEGVVREGDEGDSMFFIAGGQVAITFRGAEGEESPLSVMEAGDFFGEASLLTGEKRTTSATALSGVDCYRLNKEGLQATMARVPDLAEDLAVVVAHRQTELDTVREKLDRETAERRETENQTRLVARIRRFFSE